MQGIPSEHEDSWVASATVKKKKFTYTQTENIHSTLKLSFLNFPFLYHMYKFLNENN